MGIERDISMVRTGFHTDGKPMEVTTPPPTLGQHNQDLLSELGYNQETIDKFIAEGVI